MKSAFLFIFLCCTSYVYSQYDKSHWFAPLFDGQELERSSYILALSTAEITPFQIIVESAGEIIATGLLSNTSPLNITIDKNYISTKKKTDVLSVIHKGIVVKGNKNFFAHLKFSIRSDADGSPVHSEIITSKGTQALGKSFSIANMPNVIQHNDINFQASVMATEDHTILQFKNIDPALKFYRSLPVVNERFILNKGESFIIAGSTFSTKDNFKGLIGVDVIADKPVTLSNGNFNGQYVDKFYEVKSDILLDQSVPIEKLGNEYVIVKGISPIESNMEKVLIIAVHDNTIIKKNGIINNDIILNKDNFLILGKEDFINGAIHLSGNNNFYVYQLFASGQGSNPSDFYESGGMMLIPPLNCYFTREVDNISFADEHTSTSFNTILNIITKKGGEITINGSQINAASSENQIQGTNEWVYHTIPHVSGNIKIKSSDGMFVQLLGGNNRVGYGASYSGFQKDPEITTEGNKTCIPGVVLGIDSKYDSYQWKFNNSIIPGATGDTFMPDKEGNYSCIVKNSGCTGIEIPEIYVYACENIMDVTYEICSILQFELDKIHPDSIPTSFELIEKPLNGILTINNRVIHYELLKNAQKDFFSYKICDNNGSCYRVNVHLTVKGSFTEPPIEKSICANDTTVFLELSQAYDSYQWSSGETSSSMHASIGSYWVDVEKNNCFSRQYFEVKKQNTFSIREIQISQDRVEILMSDSTQKYLYSLNNIDFQETNVFHHLKSGNYKLYVKVAGSDCQLEIEEFIVFNPSNVITPNNDGYNDVISFEYFSQKKNVSLAIFNRYGEKVYQSTTDLVWNGQKASNNLPTGIYWYVLTFEDEQTNKPWVYKGWILLKAR